MKLEQCLCRPGAHGGASGGKAGEKRGPVVVLSRGFDALQCLNFDHGASVGASAFQAPPVQYMRKSAPDSVATPR